MHTKYKFCTTISWSCCDPKRPNCGIGSCGTSHKLSSVFIYRSLLTGEVFELCSSQIINDFSKSSTVANNSFNWSEYKLVAIENFHCIFSHRKCKRKTFDFKCSKCQH
jgi:hypothetical protein